METDISFWQSIPYFSGLGPEELDSVRKPFFKKTFARGDIIVFDGEPVEALYLVVIGAVKMFRTSADGKEQVLNIVHPGESFNDVSVFDGGPNLASALAMGPVTVYGIFKPDLDKLLREHPQMAGNVVGVLAAQVRKLASLVEDLSFRPVVGRVAKVLLEYAGDGKIPGQRLTQQDMAAIAGTVREVVSRSLKSLQTDGVIQIDRHRIVVKDREALEGIAGVST